MMTEYNNWVKLIIVIKDILKKYQYSIKVVCNKTSVNMKVRYHGNSVFSVIHDDDDVYAFMSYLNLQKLQNARYT